MLLNIPKMQSHEPEFVSRERDSENQAEQNIFRNL